MYSWYWKRNVHEWQLFIFVVPEQSRILLSVADEQDPDLKSTSQNALLDWFSSLLICKPKQRDSESTHVTLFVEDNVKIAQNSDPRNETWKPIGYSEPHTNINLTYTTDFNSVLVWYLACSWFVNILLVGVLFG